ncbi:MAG: Flagellar hook-length control protein FliK [Myxococcales bacterium]|nr:Flagellar hook-length control protein FliK [Myxococcales bacterium]
MVERSRRWPREPQCFGAVVKQALIVGLLLAGCGGGDPKEFGLNVRVDAHALSTSDLNRIVSAHLSVGGDEPYEKTFDVAAAARSGEVRFRYVPGVKTGRITLAVNALDSEQAIIASGVSDPVDITTGAVAVVIRLGAAVPDMAGAGGDDGGEPGDMAHIVKGQGAACTANNECGTAGGCVDGYCCDVACTGSCVACNLPSKEGTCSPIPASATPAPGHAACGPDAKSTCQRDGSCDGGGACRKWALGTVCQAGTCNAGTNQATSDSTCNGSGTCTPGTTITCAPYVCKDATICWPTCTGNTQCSSGNFCNGNSCGKKAIGSICGSAADCQNGTDGNAHCVDGVCCDTACTGTCQYCALSATKGTCSLAPTTTDPRSVCPAGTGGNAICSPGGCTGTTMACRVAAVNTACSASCANNTAATTTCNATGSCAQTGGSAACGAYACVVGGGGTQATCNSSCATDGECNQPVYACNTTTQQCALALGKTCTAGNQCASGSCAPEGMCCTRACTGACESCSAQGVCNFVSGTPVAPRAPCNSDPSYPVCNGTCAGGSASCSYPTTAGCQPSVCGVASGSTIYIETDYACSGGACMAAQKGCGHYVCNGSQCYGAPCTSNAQCTLGYMCSFNGSFKACL